MTGPSRRVLVAVLVLAAATGAARAPYASAEPASTPTPAPRAAAADEALIQRLFQETGAERELPEPSWTEYLASLGEALLGALFSPLRGLDPSNQRWVQALAWILTSVIVVCLVFILARWIMSRRRRPVRAPTATLLAPESALPAHPPSRSAWRQEIQARLARGNVEGALEALWWWFASSLLEGTIDPSWTSRELLSQARRQDLRSQAAELDRMLYGPARPTPADVLRLTRALEGRLA